MSTVELQAIDRRIEALLQSQEMDREDWKALRSAQADTDTQLKESQAETARQLKELGKQIGGLGNKFGSFAEGLSYSSIKRILVNDFKMNEFIAPGVTVERDGLEDEYDVLAYSNGTIDQGMIVEIKSKLTQRDIDQMKRKMEDVFRLMPEHRNKTFYGMVAYVSGHTDLKRQIIENGWYLAHVGDEIFEMEIPIGFQPKAYQAK